MARIPVVELIRVSTAEQGADDRAGIARQEAACAKAVVTHGLEVVRRFRLVDVSGTSVQETSEMAELLELVRSGSARGVVVADFDRLLRPDDFRSFAVLQDILEAGAIIYLSDQALDLSTQSGWLTSSLQSVIAGNERTQIMKRMNGAKEAMRRAGKHPGGDMTLPRGVSYDREAERFFYDDDAEIVRELFHLFHARRIHNYSELARRTGLGRSNVPELLTNPLYIGLRVYDEKRGRERYASENGRRAAKKRVQRAPDEVIEVRVIEQPLVSEEVFWAVQDVILNKKRRVVHQREDGDLAYLFKGMLRCGYDDEPIYTTGQCVNRRGAPTYYICKRKESQYVRKGLSCQSKAYPGPRLEAHLVGFIADRLASVEYIQAQVAGMVDHDALARRKRSLEKVRAEIKAVAGKEQRLVDLHVDGAIERGMYDRKMEELRREMARLEAQENALRGTDVAIDPEEHAETVTQMALAFCEFPLWKRAEQRQFLEALQPEFWITTEGVTKVSLPLCETGGVVRGESEGRL